MDPTTLITGLALGVVLIYIACIVIWMIFWISTIIYQAKRKQWVWMVFTLLFNITLILYWIVWLFNPKLRRKKK